MTVIDALRAECIAVNATISDKTQALRKVAECAKQSAILDSVDTEEIVRSLEERENLGSTGFGKGIAIPHCRLPAVSDFVIGIVTVPEGVDFDAVDEKPVQLIAFIIAPEDTSNTHLRLLSSISQVLQDPKAVQEIIAGSTAEVVRESFLRHAAGELDTTGRTGTHAVCIVIQNEKLFYEILEVFSGMKATSAVVLKSENMRAHLGRIPLFQGLWTQEPGGFSHTILATVGKGLVNELVRQIETRTGDLDKCTDIMITVQEVFYTAGSLNP